ncbi:hypothetical protein BC936DRAFT_149074 [Jimgerdemannia flammicorona]|uniref:SET domain-containing protein n=1 Tax=Jimgerdemannia flammicorona TaxID=994334 RepID=A0A433D1L8_9FUNG|nr:hypothetical protein BC936DRAFT_149074 [Jimgerdemannia flammicorona]
MTGHKQWLGRFFLGTLQLAGFGARVVNKRSHVGTTRPEAQEDRTSSVRKFLRKLQNLAQGKWRKVRQIGYQKGCVSVINAFIKVAVPLDTTETHLLVPNLPDANGIGGVYATSPIQIDEVYASIPFKLTISEPLVREAFPQFSHLSSRAVMSTFIVREDLRGETSFYHPYLQVIPREIMTAMRFGDDDMLFLSGTNLENGAKERREKLREEFDHIVHHMPDGLDADTLDWFVTIRIYTPAFLWAYTAISSRAFPHKLLDPTSEAAGEAMFPLADSMNHRPRTKVTWRSQGGAASKDGVLELIAGEEVGAGEQLYNNYGPKYYWAMDFALRYQFSSLTQRAASRHQPTLILFPTQNNPYDYVHLKVNFSRDPQAATKQLILDRIGMTDLKHFIQREHVPAALLAQLRVLVMNRTETTRYAGVAGPDFEFVGYRNELAMLGMLERLLGAKLDVLRRVGETLAEEEEWKEWQRFAVWYREGQDAVLCDALAITQTKFAKTAAQMRSDLLSGRLSRAPFLRIDNPDTLRSPYADEANLIPSSSEDLPWITIDGALAEDSEFASAVKDMFEDEAEEEQDTFLMMYLVRESGREGSRWKRALEELRDFEVQSDPQTNPYDDDQELRDLYDYFFPRLSDRFPEVFDAQLFEFERFAWAAGVLDAFSVTMPRHGLEDGETVCVVLM